MACIPASLRNAGNSDHLLLCLGNRDYNLPKSQHTPDVFWHLMILSDWEADYLESRICPLKKLLKNLIMFLFWESSDWKIGLPVHFQSLNVFREKLTFLKRNRVKKIHTLTAKQLRNDRETGIGKRRCVTLFRHITKSLYFQNLLSLFCTTSWFRIMWSTSPTVCSDPHS